MIDDRLIDLWSNSDSNSHDNVYGAVIVAVHCHCESSPGSSDECSTQRQMAADLCNQADQPEPINSDPPIGSCSGYIHLFLSLSLSLSLSSRAVVDQHTRPQVHARLHGLVTSTSSLVFIPVSLSI